MGGTYLKKVAIITDSIACLPHEQAEKYSIGVIPVNIIFEGKVFRDWIDITPTEAYRLFLKNPDAFATSAPSPGECLTAYRQASQEAESVICITVSAKLSSTYNVASMAKDYALKEIPGVRIEVINSLTATAAEGLIAVATAKAVDSGADFESAVKTAYDIRNRVHVYILLDTMRHVYRSGRIPKIASQAGTFLNIRPVFSVHEKVHFTGMVRSREQGVETILGKIKEKSGKNPVFAAVMHAYAPEAAIELRDRLAKELNCIDLWLTEFSPVMGYACGTGTLAVAFYSESP